MRTRSVTMGRGARRAATGRSGWRAPAPRFAGVVRGELLKLAGMRMAWILATLFLAIVCLPHLATFGNALIARNLERDPAATAYLLLGSRLLMVRAAAGICLILLAARLASMEYSGGTIRVLLARGVGRAQLLAGKLAALALVALGALAVGVGLTLTLLFLGLASLAGWAMALRVVAPEFLADTALYAATIVVSMGATILMAAGVAVVGRSLSFGLSVGVSWFTVDNFAVLACYLALRLTGNPAFALVTGDFLGPNLNAMPAAVLPPRAAAAGLGAASIPPLVPVDGAHTLLVAGAYAAAFALVAFLLIARREVRE